VTAKAERGQKQDGPFERKGGKMRKEEKKYLKIKIKNKVSFSVSTVFLIHENTYERKGDNTFVLRLLSYLPVGLSRRVIHFLPLFCGYASPSASAYTS
jgi:hypothetical protein